MLEVKANLSENINNPSKDETFHDLFKVYEQELYQGTLAQDRIERGIKPKETRFSPCNILFNKEDGRGGRKRWSIYFQLK